MQLELGQLDLRYAALRIHDPSRERRLLASMLEHGQQTPVLVVRDGEAWVLIDGYLRVVVLGKLARDLVDAAVMDVAEAEALVLGHRLDNGRERTGLEEGWLLRELVERHGVVQAELARRLDRSASWVSRRLALVRSLPEVVQEAVRVGKLSVQAATRVMVPLARANVVQCERLMHELGSQRVGVRPLTRLYVAWKASDEPARERLVAEPQLFLRTLEVERKDALPEEDEAVATLRDLSLLSAVCLRLARRASESGDPVSERGRVARRRAWTRATGCFEALRSHFEETTNDAGLRHPNGDLATPQRRPRLASDRANAEDLARSRP